MYLEGTLLIYGELPSVPSTPQVVVEITLVIQGSTSIKPEKSENSDRGILTLSLSLYLRTSSYTSLGSSVPSLFQFCSLN